MVGQNVHRRHGCGRPRREIPQHRRAVDGQRSPEALLCAGGSCGGRGSRGSSPMDRRQRGGGSMESAGVGTASAGGSTSGASSAANATAQTTPAPAAATSPKAQAASPESATADKLLIVVSSFRTKDRSAQVAADIVAQGFRLRSQLLRLGTGRGWAVSVARRSRRGAEASGRSAVPRYEGRGRGAVISSHP